MSDARKVRFDGEELGTFKLNELYRARTKGDLDYTAEFFSEKRNQWLPLAGILEDLDTTVTRDEQIKDLKAMGFRMVKLLGSPNEGVCPVCTALVEIAYYDIDQVPPFPPDGCTCTPWCSFCVIVDDHCRPQP